MQQRQNCKREGREGREDQKGRADQFFVRVVHHSHHAVGAFETLGHSRAFWGFLAVVEYIFKEQY